MYVTLYNIKCVMLCYKDVMLFNMCHVVLGYITCALLCYITKYVMLYNIKYVTLYMCHVMLYNVHLSCYVI